MLGDRQPVPPRPLQNQKDRVIERQNLPQMLLQQQRLRGAEKLLGRVVDEAKHVVLVQHYDRQRQGAQNLRGVDPDLARRPLDDAKGTAEAAHAAIADSPSRMQPASINGS